MIFLFLSRTKVQRDAVIPLTNKKFSPAISRVMEPPSFVGTPNVLEMSPLLSEIKGKFNWDDSLKYFKFFTSSPLMPIIVAPILSKEALSSRYAQACAGQPP